MIRENPAASPPRRLLLLAWSNHPPVTSCTEHRDSRRIRENRGRAANAAK